MGHQISIPNAISQPKPFLSNILDPQQYATSNDCDKEMQQILPQFSNQGKGANNETELQFDIKQINEFLLQYFKTNFLKFELPETTSTALLNSSSPSTTSPLSTSPKRNVIHEWIWKETLFDKIILWKWNSKQEEYKRWRHFSYDQFYKATTFILSHLLTHYPIMKQQQLPTEEDEDLECCICMQHTIDSTLQCGHSFCLQCIQQWNAKSKSHSPICPLCKQEYEQEEENWTWESYPLNSKQVLQQLLSHLWRL